MMCEHPTSPPAKKIKATSKGRTVMATVFWDHKGVLLVKFLDLGDTVTFQHYCDTLDRLQQAIHHKRLLQHSHSVITLHTARSHTGNQTCD